MKLQAVVFDFDGTLADTEWVEFESARLVCAEYDASMELADWIAVVGTLHSPYLPDLIAERTGRRALDVEVRERRDLHRQRLHAEMTLLPGARELLDALRDAGVPMAIATNSETVWVEMHTRRLRIASYFSHIVSIDLVARGKPAPDPFLLACDLLEADPAASAAIEDSRVGSLSAVAAGLYTVVVPNGITRYQDLSHAHRIADSLRAVTVADLDAAVHRRIAR